MEGRTIHNTQLPTERHDMPPVPTPEVISTYKRKERHLGKRREKWKAGVLASVPSVTVPDHSVLAAFPESYWKIPGKRKDKSVRKIQEQAQEDARLVAFKQERVADINRAVTVETQKFQAIAAENKRLYGKKGDDARAYAVAMTLNGLAERPNQHAGEQLQKLLANMNPVVREGIKILGKILPGKDIFEQISDVMGADQSAAGASIAKLGEIVKVVRDGLVNDHGVDYDMARLKVRDPRAHRRHHRGSSAIEGIAKAVALPAAATALAKLLPPKEGAAGQVAEGVIGAEAINLILKRLNGAAPEIAEAALKVTLDTVLHKKGTKAAAHMAELLLAITFGKDAKGMSEQVADILFAEYAVEHPDAFGSIIRDTVSADMYHYAKKADEAIIGRIKDTMFRRTKAEQDAKKMSANQAAALENWGN